MSNPPQASKSIFAGWAGTEERPNVCDNTHVLEGFNVDFVEGKLQRRRGAQIISNPTQFRSNQYIYWNGGSTTDVTTALTDGDTSTAVITSIFGSVATQALYIGCANRFTGIRLILSAFTSTTNGVLTVSYPQYVAGSATNWTTIPGQIDGTTLAGVGTLRQNGNVLWSSSIFSTWDAGIPGGAGGLNNPAGVSSNGVYFDPTLFWIRLTVNVNLTGANLAECYGVWIGADGISLLVGGDAITEFTTHAGDRLVVSVTETPNFQNDSQQAYPPEVRVVAYDLIRNMASPINIDLGAKATSSLFGNASFETFNGWLLGTTSAGYVWKYNGAISGALEAMPGNDYLNNVIGAKGYFARTPRGQFITSYHGKLIIAGSREAPLTFYNSLYDNDINNIPANATVGGPNCWPIDGALALPGKEGDYITGASVVNDRYVILTRSQVWTYDDSAIRLSNGDIGCLAPGSVQRIDQAIFFLSDQGVFMHDGINAVNISAPISRTLHNVVNWKAVPVSCSSAHYKRKGEYWLFVPINGEWQTQIALVYNYIARYWRVVGGWYPFDTTARRNATALPLGYAFPATCQVRSADGRQALVSVDITGRIWQHDVGYDDNGFIYPAYAVLNRLSSYSRFLAMAASDAGEDYVSFREWYLTAEMDGSWLEGMALEDGERFDQELDRRLANVPTNSEVVQKQALIQNTVSANATELTFGTVAGWPVTPNWGQSKKLKLSFGRHVTKMQPVVHWPGGQYVTGTYTTGQVAARGGIYDIQVDGKVLPSAR